MPGITRLHPAQHNVADQAVAAARVFAADGALEGKLLQPSIRDQRDADFPAPALMRTSHRHGRCTPNRLAIGGSSITERDSRSRASSLHASVGQRQAHHIGIGAGDFLDEDFGPALDGIAARLAHAFAAFDIGVDLGARSGAGSETRVIATRVRSLPSGVSSATAVIT